MKHRGDFYRCKTGKEDEERGKTWYTKPYTTM